MEISNKEYEEFYEKFLEDQRKARKSKAVAKYLKKVNYPFLDTINSNLSKAKYRAKKRGLEFSITVEDVLIPEYCPVFPWIKLEYKRDRYCTPSIDRIDNTKGYVPGNVRIISNRANLCKKDMSLREAQCLVENWDKKGEK